jgi:PPP family 3-phenylpropionic acid transporter
MTGRQYQYRPAKTSLFVLYIAMYGAFGVASPFLPAFFVTRGLSAEQIGLLLACGTLVKLVSGPIASRAADTFNRLHFVLALCLLVASVLAIALPWPSSFGLLLTLHICLAIALAPVTSIADALALSGAAGGRLNYGQVRGAASASFVVGTMSISYLIGMTQIDVMLYVHAALLLAAAASVRFLSGRSVSPLSVDTASLNGFATLWFIPALRSVFLVAALIYGSHAVHDAFAVIRWNAAGLTPTFIALLWSEAVIAEVLIFTLVGPRLIDKVGIRLSITAAAGMGVIRWTVAGSTTEPMVLAAVQPLHGFTFALTHLACMRVIASVAPPDLGATAQASYALSGGLATVVLTALAGPMYANFAEAAFFPMALLCGLAAPLAWIGFKTFDERASLRGEV